MKVYHGSTQAVEYPLVGVGRENLDFGKGFYEMCIRDRYDIIQIDLYHDSFQVCASLAYL